MAKDIDDIFARLVELERQAKMGTIRMATVKKDEKGSIKLLLGKKNDGKDWESPTLRKGQHHGFLNENVPFEEGQSVAVLTQDGNFRNCLVFPYTYSDHDPLPEDAKEKKITGRIRKPRESKEEEKKEAEEVKKEENKPRQQPKEYEKQKDENEKDNYWRTDYEGHYRRKKKAQYLFGEPDPEDDKSKDQSKSGQSGSSAPTTQLFAGGDAGTSGSAGSTSGTKDQKEKGSGEKGEQHWLSVGDASITIVDGKIRFKVGKNTMIFDRDGIHSAVKGQDQQSGSSGSTQQQQQQQPKTIAEDLQDIAGKFLHKLLKDQRIVQAPDSGPVHTMKLTEIVQKVGEQIFNWKKDLLEVVKGKMNHDKKNIGSTHKHTQVTPGGGLTGDPDED